MKKTIFILGAAFLLLLPFVLSFDCSLTNDFKYCESIENSNLPDSKKEELFSSLLYVDSSYPNHQFIENYNSGIKITSPPDNTPIYNSKYIKKAWLSFLAVFPAVYENNILYVPSQIKTLSEYDYQVNLPSNYKASRYPRTNQGDCKRKYYLKENQASLKYYLNGIYKGESNLNINQDGKLKAELKIYTKVKIKHYHWKVYRFLGRKYKRCKYHHTDYETDNLKITEEKEIKLLTEKPNIDLTVIQIYSDTTQAKLTAQKYSYLKVSFADSYLTKQKHYYDLVFDKKPYYFAYLKANNFSKISHSNLYFNNDTLFVKNTAGCSLFAQNHFYSFNSNCDLTLNQEEVEKLDIEDKTIDLDLLFYILTFILIIYIIYRLLKSQFKKVVPVLFIVLLCVPAAFATTGQECGLTNLASCLPEKIYSYILLIINAPLLPMLLAVKKLLTANPAVDIFQGVWSVIKYILSFFYIFLFLYAGFTFLTSNANPIKRAHAKDLLKNTFLMIILIQSSFYLYTLILNLGGILNSTLIGSVDPKFFLLTADNIINLGLQFLFSFVYGGTLFMTMLLLVLRYIVVCFGAVLFPIALFCYFIPPLKGYGRFLLNLLGFFIFVTFFDLLIILACSMIIQIPLFANFKILVMITCFTIVNYTLWLAVKFAIKRSSNTSLKDDLNQAVKYMAMLA